MVNLCLTLAAGSVSELQKKIERYDGQVPFIEVRLDFLDPFDFPVLPAGSSTLYLATCRPSREGGRFSDSEADRLRILQESPGFGFSLVDLEADLDSIPAFPEGIRIIRSSHFFGQTARSPRELYREISRLKGTFCKLALTPGNTSELLELLKCMEECLPHTPGVVLGMGKMAQITRLLGPFLGGAWTYVSEEDQAVAPGQFSLSQARRFYGLPERTCIPRLYGLAGRIDDALIDRATEALNQAFFRKGVEAMAFPLPGVGLNEFYEYAVASRLPYSGFIRLKEAAGIETDTRDAEIIRPGPDGLMNSKSEITTDRDWVDNIIEFWSE